MYRIIWSPWRYEYIKELSKERECLFCKLPRMSDDEAFIVYRGEYSYIVLNTYPYNSGHVMIAPYRHIGLIEELNDREIDEMMKFVKKIVVVMKKAFNPDGFNIGINIGKAAGAGVEDHIHIHVVPRWTGDSNFLPVASSYKSLPIALTETYKLLKKVWNSIEEQ